MLEQGPGRCDFGAILFVVLTTGFLFIRGIATTLFLVLLLLDGTIPPFLTSLQLLSTVSYTKFLVFLPKTSLDFLIERFLLGGPFVSVATSTVV